MLLHGDEMGRTQGGNNNGYCQDNDISWVDWELEEDQHELLFFTRRLVQLRRDHPVFRRRRFFAGSADHGGQSDVGDIEWFEPGGEHMDEESWTNGYAKSMAVFLNGAAIPEPDTRGQRIVDDSFLVLFNGHHEQLRFALPDDDYGSGWLVEVDTAARDIDPELMLTPGSEVTTEARSVVVLRCPREPQSLSPAGAAVGRR
jgi:glycogen operon protein